MAFDLDDEELLYTKWYNKNKKNNVNVLIVTDNIDSSSNILEDTLIKLGCVASTARASAVDDNIESYLREFDFKKVIFLNSTNGKITNDLHKAITIITHKNIKDEEYYLFYGYNNLDRVKDVNKDLSKVLRRI